MCSLPSVSSGFVLQRLYQVLYIGSGCWISDPSTPSVTEPEGAPINIAIARANN